jgi:hypothetical protein
MERRRISRHFYDPHRDAQAICLSECQLTTKVFDPPRTNYFSIYWVPSQNGEVWADAARHTFAARSLLFFKPYQYIRIIANSSTDAVLIQFHANFLCVETFHAESGCAGELFNDSYSAPVVQFGGRDGREIAAVIKNLQNESLAKPLAYEEMMLAQLKALLIMATRQKVRHAGACGPDTHGARHPAIASLRTLIEDNY